MADLIGIANFVPARIGALHDDKLEITMLGHRFTISADATRFEPQEEVDIVVRPEGVDLADSDGIPGTVTSSTYMGNMQEYTVRVGDIDLNLEAYDPAGIKIYHAGDAVCVQFRPLNLHAIKKA